jgi:hypothetical protein
MDKLLSSGITNNYQLAEVAKKKYNIPLKAICFNDQLADLKPSAKIAAYIINLASSTDSEGTHWLGLLTTGKLKQAYYFDSMGVGPTDEIVEFARRSKASGLMFSNNQIQKISANYCGQYVLEWIREMVLNPRPESYMKYINKFKTIRVV